MRSKKINGEILPELIKSGLRWIDYKSCIKNCKNMDKKFFKEILFKSQDKDKRDLVLVSKQKKIF